MPNHLPDRLRVCVIADPAQTDRGIMEIIRAALQGGATAIQLRSKSLLDRETFDLAQEVRLACDKHGALFIVNDRLDIALASGADGVHLGVDDLAIEAARQVAGDSFVIGYSPDSDEQAARAAERGASYLGVGPAFTTESKPDAGAPIGPALIGRRASLSGLPTMGIGGITPERVEPVIAAGACGVAVIGAVLHATDPRAATAALVRAVDAALGSREHALP